MEKTVDVDGMLDRIGPRVFREWMAFYRIHPFGQQWEQAGTIAAAAHNIGLLASGQKDRFPPELLEFKTEANFMPHTKPKKAKRSRAPIEEDLRAMAANR